LNIAVVLNAHENSETFRDTLESVRHHWTDRVLTVVDAKGWPQFEDDDSPTFKLEGFWHGKSSAPHRNMCLGLMKAWETWGECADWVCYMEYDCLVGSSDIAGVLSEADSEGAWIVGNDHRMDARRIPFLDRFLKSRAEVQYLLGCCLFFNKSFMRVLDGQDFFRRFLWFTNFNTDAPRLVDGSGAAEEVYDISEFMYPTLAGFYGGKVKEMACWDGVSWRGDAVRFPMRFRPDLVERSYEGSCVLHPMKDFANPVRSYHRTKRKLTFG